MSVHQLKDIFAANGVKRVLIVDDVYDPAPEYSSDDVSAVFHLFEEVDDLEEIFVGLGGTRPVDPEDLERQLQESAPLIDGIRKAAEEQPATPLGLLGSKLLKTRLLDMQARRKPLDDLIGALKALDLEPITFGSDGPGRDAERFPLIFMDYYLGDEKGPPSVARSKDRIMQIVTDYGPAEMPVVVLMSSELKDERQARAFRDEAELLGCQFKFAHKAKFADGGIDFFTSLAGIVKFLKQTRTIGSFVKAWKKALDGASKDFSKAIVSLDLQDYFQIQTKMGSDAASRFGEHMSGLFDAYLRKLVEDRPELRSAMAAMSDLTFHGRPPAPFEPSETVTKMAFAAAFQSPPDPVQGKGRALGVELGDVFLRTIRHQNNDVTEVRAVISQACDLEHGKTETILLIRGLATKRTAERLKRDYGGRPIIRTDLFRFGHAHGEVEDYIIDWDAGDVIAHVADGFESWTKRESWSKVARLRTVQALALQQRFAAHLTRVGTPDTPPPYRYPKVAVMYTPKKGKSKELCGPFDSGRRLACVIGDEKTEAVLQNTLLTQIRLGLDRLATDEIDPIRLEKAKAVLASASQSEQLEVAKLQDRKAMVGEILVWDKSTPLAAGENLPRDVFLAVILLD